MPSARASGTLTNVGNAEATYNTFLEAEVSDPFGVTSLVSGESNGTSRTLVPGAAATLVLNPLDLGNLVSLSARARVAIKVTAPPGGTSTPTVYSDWSAWYTGPLPTYTPSWSGTPAISSGPLLVQGIGVSGQFTVGIGQAEGSSYVKWIIGLGAGYLVLNAVGKRLGKRRRT